MYNRYPLSEYITTLPPRKPSPVVDSIISNNGIDYYALREGNETFYLQVDSDLKVVDSDHEDESNFLSSVFVGARDRLGNTTTSIKKYSGFLKEGFKESVSDLKVDAFDFSKDVRKLILALVAVLGIVIIFKIVK